LATDQEISSAVEAFVMDGINTDAGGDAPAAHIRRSGQ
jgi:hypothetical protein